jgi:hypothetical protein
MAKTKVGKRANKNYLIPLRPLEPKNLHNKQLMTARAARGTIGHHLFTPRNGLHLWKAMSNPLSGPASLPNFATIKIWQNHD